MAEHGVAAHRALLGFDETRRQQALSFAAALFVIGFVAPGVSELRALSAGGQLDDRCHSRLWD